MQEFLPEDGRIFILTGQNGSGKTRALERISNSTLKEMRAGMSDVTRLICLSGTVLDKFPRVATGENDYIYFGRKTNTNMFSEVAPYRRLAEFLFFFQHDWESRAIVAKEMLKTIGLGGVIGFKFRRGRNKKESIEQKGADELNINIDLSRSHDVQRDAGTRLQQLRDGILHVSSVTLEKGGDFFDITDLSSGERSYALTMLALAFSSIDKSLILFDEPENSLHPLWQSSIIKDMWFTIAQVSSDSRVIIATHSPLIISGAINEATYIKDLERGGGWAHSTMFGKTSDTILREQFELRSPRSIEFFAELRDCLKLMVSMHSNPDPFKHAADKLLGSSVVLSPEDSLYQTLEDIRAARGRLQ